MNDIDLWYEAEDLTEEKDEECWNEYCMEWVWQGDTLKVKEYQVEVCEDCEEEDGACICCEDEE